MSLTKKYQKRKRDVIKFETKKYKLIRRIAKSMPKKNNSGQAFTNMHPRYILIDNENSIVLIETEDNDIALFLIRAMDSLSLAESLLSTDTSADIFVRYDDVSDLLNQRKEDSLNTIPSNVFDQMCGSAEISTDFLNQVRKHEIKLVRKGLTTKQKYYHKHGNNKD